MVAILIVPLVGVMGIATEAGNWFAIQRSAQNAADSAAIAAATNSSGIQPSANQTYVTEGRSVASNFGFVNGANNTTVTVSYPDNTVPAKCSNNCYAVTITRTVPVYLNRVLGWGATQTVSARSVAVGQVTPQSYCLVSLGTGDSFHINGGKDVDLHGCNVLANGNTTCNGKNSNGGANSITFGPPGTGANQKCSPSVQEASLFVDPYGPSGTNISSSIPSDSCGGVYPQIPKHGTFTGTTLSGTVDWSTQTTVKLCGDVELGSNINITTASPGTALIIYNGNLDMQGFSLAATGGLTIIMSGSNSTSYSHIVTNGSLLDYSAPTSGTWKGVAMLQDQRITNNVDMSAAGNSPGWSISGLIYVPNSNLSFSGTVNKATSGLDCFVLIDKTFQTNGTGNILENQSQCAQQGVTLPTTDTLVRTSLVL